MSGNGDFIDFLVVYFESFRGFEVERHVRTIEIFALSVFVGKLISSLGVSETCLLLVVDEVVVLNDQEVVNRRLVIVTLFNTIVIFEDVSFSTRIADKLTLVIN